MPREPKTKPCKCNADPLLVIKTVDEDACGSGCCTDTVMRLYQCPECKTIWEA